MTHKEIGIYGNDIHFHFHAFLALLKIARYVLEREIKKCGDIYVSAMHQKKGNYYFAVSGSSSLYCFASR